MAGLLTGPERALLELKREWPDLSAKQGKAELAKLVMAMANSVPSGSEAYIVFGVEDLRQGGKVFGVAAGPTPEAIAEILAAYIDPPPATHLEKVTYEERTVQVLVIERSVSGPHAPFREHDGILRRGSLYVRRDGLTAEATVHEVIGLARGWRSGAEGVIVQRALQAGFIDIGRQQDVAVQVRNISGATLSAVDVLLDIRSVRHPELVHRMRRFVQATIPPGETLQADFDCQRITFYRSVFLPDGLRQWATVNGFGGSAGDGWWDLALIVSYRGPEGFIETVVSRTSVEW